ncbi:MAG: type II 3-dehydroquinate dehydratase [Agrobacterium sp.]|nr:type II 3-dehydroquinate dehydratase [Agrobacterium sp.]
MDNILKSDKKVRVVLKEFPILGPESVAAHRVSNAVKLLAPAKYPEFQRALLGGRGRANEDSAMEVATSLGLKEADIRKSMAENPNWRTGAGSLPSSPTASASPGTPSYIVGNRPFSVLSASTPMKEKIANMRGCRKSQLLLGAQKSRCIACGCRARCRLFTACGGLFLTAAQSIGVADFLVEARMSNIIIVLSGPNLNMLGKKGGRVSMVARALKDIENEVSCGRMPVSGSLWNSASPATKSVLVDWLHGAGERGGERSSSIPAPTATPRSRCNDAIRAISTPVVEVHISSIHARKGFRLANRWISPAAKGMVCGFGPYGCIMALHALKNITA